MNKVICILYLDWSSTDFTEAPASVLYTTLSEPKQAPARVLYILWVILYKLIKKLQLV